MKRLGLLLLLLVGFAASDTHDDTDKKDGENLFSKGRKIYTSEHDIANIFVPLPAAVKIAYNGSESERRALAKRDDLVEYLFFVQGDFKDDGTFENKGLYVFKPVTGEATKLLDHGVDMTSVLEEGKTVYFAATDGIYFYNAQKNTAEKYGSLTDNFISIAQTKTEDVIYALTAEHVLYKVTDNGKKKEKVDDVKDALYIVLDTHDNLYFYDSKMHIFVKKYSEPEAPLIEFTHLPITPKKIRILRPLFDLPERLLVVLDDRVIVVNSKGEHTNDESFFKPIVSATAHSIEGRIIFYMGFNKDLYEYNILKMSNDPGHPESSGDDILKHALHHGENH